VYEFCIRGPEILYCLKTRVMICEGYVKVFRVTNDMMVSLRICVKISRKCYYLQACIIFKHKPSYLLSIIVINGKNIQLFENRSSLTSKMDMF